MNFSTSLCIDGIWNESRFRNENYSVFTDCFQYSLLLLGPCALGIMSVLFFVFKYLEKVNLKWDKSHSFDFRHVIEIMLPIICFIFTLWEMISEYQFNGKNDPMFFISYGAMLISLISLPLIFELRRFGQRFMNVICFVFWWLTVATYSIRFYGILSKYIQVQNVDGTRDVAISATVLFLLLSSLIIDSFSRSQLITNTNINPEKSSSILSQVTFSWLDRYIYRWFKKEMTNETVFDLNETDKSKKNTDIIEELFIEKSKKQYILKQCLNSERSEVLNEKSLLLDKKEKSPFSGMIMLKSLFETYFKSSLAGWTLKIFRDILIMTLPFTLKSLLDYFKRKENNIWKGILLASIFFFQGLIGNVFENYCYAITNKISIRVRGALTGMIYKKSLRLSTEAKTVYSPGDIVNMVSVDIEQITNWIDYSWIIISCPLQIILSIVLLYLELGFAIFGGVLIIIASIPMNTIVMKFTRKYSVKEFSLKDKRIGLLSEIINGIRLIKMYTWEKSFSSKIENLRNKELNNIRNVSVGYCLVSVMWDLIPFLVMYISFMIYIYSTPSPIINAEIIFVSLILFNNLQLPTVLLPWGLNQTISALVSFGRIENFLVSQEGKSYISDILDHDENFSVNSIEIKDGHFSWRNDGLNILKNINFVVEKQKLIAIVGKVGVGKSSLLSAILGEINCVGGSVKKRGSIAFVPQEAWIQNNSIKNNILFTKCYNKFNYEKIIKACCLDIDIDMFPMKDETEIGEKGINLSGGQKQRVSLARAIYQDCDIYLLDDPLAAVDVKVGQQLFGNVISNKGLLKSKTRILVTHGIKWLPFVDEIFIINSDGRISAKGKYEFLLNSCEEFQIFIEEKLQRDKTHQSELEKTSNTNEYLFTSSTKECENDEIHFTNEKDKTYESVKEKDDSNEEEVMKGEVSLSSLFWYFKARGFFIFVLSIFSCVIFGVLQAFGNIWLGKLSDYQSSTNITNHRNHKESAKYYINYYGIIGIGQFFMIILFWSGFTFGSLKASKKIHEKLLKTILRGTLSFFDVTPSGRIINRFTNDLYLMDHILNTNMTDIINRFVILIMSFIVISYVTPWFILLGIPITIAYFFLQKFYISSTRQSRRLDSQASSFIFTHSMETCKGSSVIRAFKAEDHFLNTQFCNLDKANKFKLIQYFSLRWLCFRLYILGNIIVFGSVLFSIIYRSHLSPSLVGLSVSYALQITGILYWLTLQYSEFETNSVSIERLREYTKIPTEARWYSNNRLPTGWVFQGNIYLQNFFLQYKINSPLILKDINLKIAGGEKIGIVGRTGAGKSSLTLALFRLVEGYKGEIFIDDVNISVIGLYELRKELTIIPQDPIIFSGTLRQNLDPFNEFSDEILLNSLIISGLEPWVYSLQDSMNYDCGDMGINLSMGQKQLICLARAILRKTKIIILDEATASVDLETDRKIMDAIKSQFSQSTVLIIAHRISTIINCDKILIMDNGYVVEYGSVEELMRNPSGIFRSMVQEESSNKHT